MEENISIRINILQPGTSTAVEVIQNPVIPETVEIQQVPEYWFPSENGTDVEVIPAPESMASY